MKYLFILVAALALAVSTFSQTAKISEKDIRPLEGMQWIGNLAYLDYSSKRKTSIKSKVTITRSTVDKLTWIFDLQYPLEPGANKRDKLKLAANGSIFNSETVIERSKLPGGVLRIVTSKPGKDDNREAMFKHTYLISKNAFSIQKEVKLDGTNEFFERNTYSWTR